MDHIYQQLRAAINKAEAQGLRVRRGAGYVPVYGTEVCLFGAWMAGQQHLSMPLAAHQLGIELWQARAIEMGFDGDEWKPQHGQPDWKNWWDLGNRLAREQALHNSTEGEVR